MSCRRIRRELLWLVRFGEFDAGSAPHLEHLAGCRDCRDEVGLDRALVRQLRTALAERIGDAIPSPSAWEGVLARMRQPEAMSPIRPWSARLAALLRAGSAMAGASLALVLALNLEMAPIGAIALPEATDVSETSAPRGESARQWDGRGATGRGAPEATAAFWLPTPSEQLPLPRSVLEAEADEDPEVTPRQPADSIDNGPSVVLRLVPGDAAAMSASSESSSDEASDEPAHPAVPPVGGPS